MSLLSRLESRFGHWAIPNVTAIIIAGQVLLYFLAQASNQPGAGFNLFKIPFLPGLVLQGEVWRIVTFIFYPPASSPMFVIFFWFLFYTYGTSLERLWGTARYNLYLLIAFLAHISTAFVVWSFGGDASVISSQFFMLNCSRGICSLNGLIYGTVFLAFARLYPDFIINMFFILPIRIKWLALITWLGYGYVMIRGDWMVRIIAFGTLLNYLLFFGREHWRDWKQGNRRRSFQAQVKKATKKFAHECQVCGLNSEDSPKTLFRYCSQCDGQCCYCPEHIRDHEHVKAGDSQSV